MGLTAESFALTDEQIGRINQHFSEQATKRASQGADAAWGAKVEFEWTPGLGRTVTAYFDGAQCPVVIESWLVDMDNL